jgi:hypothetical protein
VGVVADNEDEMILDGRFVNWSDEFGKHRAKIVEFHGELGMDVKWTGSCSGCYESGQDAPFDNKAKCFLGMGCSECGYKGKTVNHGFAPLPEAALESLRKRGLLK